MAVWRSTPPDGEQPGRVVVVASGFGQRMRHVGPVAAYLVANGATVYRFDPVCHPGLSDGEVRDYSLTGVLDSLTAVCAAARAASGGSRLALVAASLSARPAIRLAAERDWFDRVVLLVGVVDYLDTVTRVLGTDYSLLPPDQLPPTVRIERQVCDPSVMWLDERRAGWGRADQTVADLSRVQVPVVNFVSSADEWVDVDQAAEVLRRGAGGERYLVRLPEGQHRIAANPVALRTLLRRTTAVTLCPRMALAGMVAADEPDHAGRVAEPGFDELVDLQVRERAWERELAAGLGTDLAAAGSGRE